MTVGSWQSSTARWLDWCEALCRATAFNATANAAVQRHQRAVAWAAAWRLQGRLYHFGRFSSISHSARKWAHDFSIFRQVHFFRVCLEKYENLNLAVDILWRVNYFTLVRSRLTSAHIHIHNNNNNNNSNNNNNNNNKNKNKTCCTDMMSPCATPQYLKSGIWPQLASGTMKFHLLP